MFIACTHAAELSIWGGAATIAIVPPASYATRTTHRTGMTVTRADLRPAVANRGIVVITVQAGNYAIAIGIFTNCTK